MPRPVALIGPTGSGKSTAALQAARSGERPVELVAIDAFTVYRGMDVGTATPTPEERTQVPHHMVDVLEPEQECSVAWFQDRARTAIEDVMTRGAVPLLVGGSGLYYRCVVDPLEFAPTDPEVRQAIRARWASDPGAGHRHLAEQDPDAAGRIEPDNLRRTVRALEVMALTGRRFSEFHKAWNTYEAIYPGIVVLGIEIDRPALRTALAARTERMLAGGWLEEVEALRGRVLSDTARQAIGYAELRAHLDGEMTWDDALERITVRTRRFATKQQRWFASDPRVRWVHPNEAAAALIAAIRAA